MGGRKTKTPAPAKPTLDEILACDPKALALLAASDRETWKCLLNHMEHSPAAPSDFLRALLAIDSFEGWNRRTFAAFQGLNPDEGMGLDWHFRRWFLAGIEHGFPPTEPITLDARYKQLLKDTGPDATQKVRELAVDVANAGDSEPHRRLLGRAYLLMSRRLGEDLDHDAAIAVAQSAEAEFAALGDDTWRAQAVRMRGAALLRQRKIDEALAVLDTVGNVETAGFASEGDYRYPPKRPLDEIDTALDNAAKIAPWAKATTPEWLLALGKVAEVTGHRGCAARAATQGATTEVAEGVQWEDWEIPGPMR